MPVIPVRIAEIRQATPTVKTLRLDLLGREFSFHPGQWIDCYADIEGERRVAGYTLTSSPNAKDHMEISVKTGDNPVTRLIHESAQVGDTLHVDGGQGSTYYTREMGDRLVLIAGGIGVTPIISILRYADEAGDVCATILYSASSLGELLYREEIEAMEKRNGRIRAHFFVTGEVSRHRQGRINEAALRELALDTDALYFISGPRDMIMGMVAALRNLGVDEANIRYEVWW
ncbi:MAG: FAD-dependent oxidoreductase [Candidatus Bathyarchaeota archaeon]